MPESDSEVSAIPYDIGYSARSRSHTLQDNPFKGKGFRNSWEAGWNKADALIRDAHDAFNEAMGEE